MSDHQPPQLPGDRPTLESVHQLAFARSKALNLLLEKTMDRQASLQRRKLQLEARIEALLEEVQKLRACWEILLGEQVKSAVA